MTGTPPPTEQERLAAMLWTDETSYQPVPYVDDRDFWRGLRHLVFYDVYSTHVTVRSTQVLADRLTASLRASAQELSR